MKPNQREVSGGAPPWEFHLTAGRFREAAGIGRDATMPVLEFFGKGG